MLVIKNWLILTSSFSVSEIQDGIKCRCIQIASNILILLLYM